jgi:hypothetical protein
MRFSKNVVDCVKNCHGDNAQNRGQGGNHQGRNENFRTILNLTCPGKNAYVAQFCIELN